MKSKNSTDLINTTESIDENVNENANGSEPTVKGSEPTSKDSEPAIKVKEREEYYRDKLASLLTLIILSAILCGILVIFNGILFYEKENPPKAYFRASDQKQILQEAPLDQAHIQTNILLSWIIEGMMNAHTFNFMNYTRLIQNAKEYFSEEGYRDYIGALNSIGLLDRLLREKLVLIGTPAEAPKILKEGVFANRYMWKIKVPMRFNYRNFSSNHEDLYNLILLVIRVSTEQSPNGVIIYKYQTEFQEHH